MNQTANGFGETPSILNGINNMSMAYNQLLYQKILIDAASVIDKPAQELASNKLYCINNLNWTKTKTNLICFLLPLIILIIIIIINVYIVEIPVIMVTGIVGMMAWYLFYGFIYSPYLNLYKWNKMLYDINISNSLDIKKCV